MNYYRGNVTPRQCGGGRPSMPDGARQMIQHREHRSLAMAYVPWQEYRDLYESDVAWKRGTLFQELDMAFAGKRG